MNFSPYKISENFVLKKLNYIKDGKLSLENYDGKIHQFGNQESSLSAKIKIHNPKFYFNIIRGGSSALGESYIKNEFETPFFFLSNWIFYDLLLLFLLLSYIFIDLYLVLSFFFVFC